MPSLLHTVYERTSRRLVSFGSARRISEFKGKPAEWRPWSIEATTRAVTSVEEKVLSLIAADNRVAAEKA